MVQEALSVERRKLSRSMSPGWRVGGLKWRITGTLVGLTVVFGVIVLVSVSQLLIQALRTQMSRQSLEVATNLSDAAAGYVIGRNSLELNALVAKYALLDDVAYVFIQDRQGKILARSAGEFPREFGAALSPGQQRRAQQRILKFRGKAVMETSVPVLEGQAGSAHVAVWEDAAWDEILRVLLPLAELIAVVVVIGILASVFLARGIIRPILRLSRIAENMSRGDLDSPVPVKSGGEIGDLACSLERMRASLKAAMVRLGRERALHPAVQGPGEKNEHVA